MQKFSIFSTIITTVIFFIYLLVIDNIVVLFDSLESYIIFRMITQICIIIWATITLSLTLLSVIKEKEKLNNKAMLVCLVTTLIIIISQIISVYMFTDEVYYFFNEYKFHLNK